MKVFITTYGTRGDVQPYIAIGVELKSRGHDVLIATSSRFKDFVEEYNLEFAPLSDSLLSIVDTPLGKDLLEKSDNFYRMIKQGMKVKKKAEVANKSLLKENWEIAKKFAPDIIVYHPKSLAAPHIAEKLSAKAVFATPIPMFIPTSEFSFLNFPKFLSGKWFNKLSFKMIKKLTEMTTRSYVNQFRNEIGLSPIKKIDISKSSQGENVPTIHLHSEFVLPRPNDWHKDAVVTGYCFLKRKQDWTPPKKLVEFLESGDPPIYIGFGSMAGREPEKLASSFIEAILKSGQRGIIATGWGGLKVDHLPKSIFAIDQVPHDWLFPRVAAVIHHGGAGSTAAGLKAGRPTLIVPFFGDQPFWGKQVYKIGAGPKPIPRKNLNCNSLVNAISQLVGDETIKDKAVEIGEKISNEDGVQEAARIIENCI